jgi:hypothetical protein
MLKMLRHLLFSTDSRNDSINSNSQSMLFEALLFTVYFV